MKAHEVIKVLSINPEAEVTMVDGLAVSSVTAIDGRFVVSDAECAETDDEPDESTNDDYLYTRVMY
jgi:hypothetical protein